MLVRFVDSIVVQAFYVLTCSRATDQKENTQLGRGFDWEISRFHIEEEYSSSESIRTAP